MQEENNNSNIEQSTLQSKVIKKKRIIWIDNLKLFACYGVLLGHCYSLFIGQNLYGKEQITSTLSTILKILSFIYNGDMWVIVFCMISGYLLSSKTFLNLRELFKSILKRYMRFVEPLILLALFIVILNKTLGFEIRSPLLANNWVGLPMTVNLRNVLKMIFLFDSYLDNPLWTLRGIFIGGIILYLINYITNKLNIKKPGILIYSIAFILFVLGLFNFDALVCSCVIIGGGYKYIVKQKVIPIKLGIIIIGVCIVLVGGLQNLVCSLFDITSHFIVDRKWYVFYWFIIMFIMLSNEDITESFLGRKQITKDNNHSFFVYILHFIILKSIIVVFFHLFIQNITFSCSVLFATILCMLITFIFAKIFSLCFMFAKKSINKLVIRGERI